MSENQRRSRTQAIGGLIAKLTAPLLVQRGIAETRIVTDWPAIVGVELARRCLPERLAFAPGRRREGTLCVRVESAWALELQHGTPAIVERINTYFGYRAVARLDLIQAPVLNRGPAASRPATAPEPQAASPPHAPDPRPAPALEKVRDGELRGALQRLGAAIGGSRARP